MKTNSKISFNVLILIPCLFLIFVCCKKSEEQPAAVKVLNSDELLNTTPQDYSGPEIVRLAWGSIPEQYTSVTRFQELKDAGFTHHFQYSYSNANEVQKVLDAAQSVGIKVLITCPELYSDPEGTLRRFMNHPALWGYFAADEPGDESGFIRNGSFADRIRAVDIQHPCYLNVIGGGKYNTVGGIPYETYLSWYEKYFNPELISFDNYPINIQNGQNKVSISTTWYDNLEVISAYARNKNKPFWAFALSVPHQLTSKAYPTPTIEYLRLQVFSDLAYGAQGIQYFTYWTPVNDPNSDEKYYSGPITVDGTKTPIYDLVKTINSEIKNLSFVFKGSKVNWVRTQNIIGSTSDQLNTTSLTAADLATTSISAMLAESGVLVSQIDNGGIGYLVVVNYSFSTSKLNIGTIKPTKRILKNGASVDAEKQVNLLPGDMVIYSWKK